MVVSAGTISPRQSSCNPGSIPVTSVDISQPEMSVKNFRKKKFAPFPSRNLSPLQGLVFPVLHHRYFAAGDEREHHTLSHDRGGGKFSQLPLLHPARGQLFGSAGSPQKGRKPPKKNHRCGFRRYVFVFGKTNHVHLGEPKNIFLCMFTSRPVVLFDEESSGYFLTRFFSAGILAVAGLSLFCQIRFLPEMISCPRSPLSSRVLNT